jgi:death-on-curing protein
VQPYFLTIDEVLRIHEDQIERYGGSAGIRDRDLLESAIAQPQATFCGEYLHKDIFEVAAAYLFHIVENHPFVDGNKRVATATAVVFLELNGVELRDALDEVTASGRTELESTVIEVTTKRVTKAALAEFLRGNARVDGE